MRGFGIVRPILFVQYACNEFQVPEVRYRAGGADNFYWLYKYISREQTANYAERIVNSNYSTAHVKHLARTRSAIFYVSFLLFISAYLLKGQYSAVLCSTP